jgi:hypothetical protein
MPALRTFCAALLIAASLAACGSSGSAGDGDLVAALALTPRSATSVLYTDWAALGHGAADAHAPEFAGQLASYDRLMRDDLGFRSADARWEADITLPGAAPVAVFQFDGKTDLGKVAIELTSFHYAEFHSGSDVVLTGGSAQPDPEHLWELAMGAVAIDPLRNVLVVGRDVNLVQSIAARGPSLGGRADVKAAVAQVGKVVGAALMVGAPACVPVADVVGRSAPPAAVASLRRQLTALGTYSPFTVDAVGVTDAAGTSGTAALVFSDAAAARANRKARSAAPAVMSRAIGAAPDALVVDSSSVEGPVLKLSLRTSGPRVVPQAVDRRSLGFDVCG